MRTRETNNYHDQIFKDCPGAWFGNMPKPEEGLRQGVITVNIEYTLPAIKYLSRHYILMSTHTPPNYGSGTGIMIKFQMKGA